MYKRNNAVSVISVENPNTLKYDTISMKHYFFLLLVTCAVVITVQYSQMKNLLIYWKFLV